MNASSSTQASHFNLHVSGIGYLNRVRWVSPKQRGRSAEPFLACSISALRGNAQAPDYTYFDLRVSGQEAAELVEKCMEDVDQDRKVVISFKVGDIYPHQYERDVKENGRKTGEKEMACLIKGRLLLINTITVDGARVYEREAAAHAEPGADDHADDIPPQGSDDSVLDGGEQSQDEPAPASAEQARPVQRIQALAPANAPRPSLSRHRTGARETATA
ncbi:DUF3577 domain-containing protein [Hydrogenophaga pseudoflava]|uniref:DUF3577 domain-containing protein n=1 Tax=Hydrogenophaga pseudoflava TaxID=47421 RepID=A0A4P6WXP6_HYDPS|nr:DUF3577 domain-containing protein [Hydrogenophaga pseudoflava]QBM28370.1 hypothetical protein HPF_11775 [Hydrogenophaga pseudoflava]